MPVSPETQPNGTTVIIVAERYGDGALRGMWRLAASSVYVSERTGVPEETWPAHVIVNLIEEIIRLRGTDTAWLTIHPELNGCGECITQEMFEKAEQEARDRTWGDASDLL